MGGGNKAARQNEGGRQERFPTSALLTRTGGATHSTHGVPWMQKQSLGFPTVTVGQRMGTFWYPPPKTNPKKVPSSSELSCSCLSQVTPSEMYYGH